MRILIAVSALLAISGFGLRSVVGAENNSGVKCGLQKDGGFVICEGPAPSTALTKYRVADLRFRSVVYVAKDVALAKVRDPDGFLHSLAVGDRIGNEGHTIRAISKGEMILGVRDPNSDGYLKEREIRVPLERPARNSK